MKRPYATAALWWASGMAALGSALVPQTCWAPFDAFLKIAGIDGGSTDSKHKGEIDALAYHWGESHQISGTVGGGGGSGRVNMDPLTVTKRLDKASPALAQACAQGKIFRTVKLVLTTADGNKAPFMEYRLSNAILSSVHVGGSTQGESGMPTEELSFTFSKIEWTYTAYGPDGRPQGNVSGAWDLAANTP